jgi:hypothetical protein
MTELDKAKQEAWENYEYEEGNLYSTSFNRGFELGAKWQSDRLSINDNKRSPIDYFIEETGLHMDGNIDTVKKGLVSISEVYKKAKELENKRLEQLKDFDTWKEWKNGSMPDL